jgi:hypothetical protein
VSSAGQNLCLKLTDGLILLCLCVVPSMIASPTSAALAASPVAPRKALEAAACV